MHKFLKTGLLLVLLVVPVSLFLFLKLFGENHFDLPYFHPLHDEKTGEAVLNGRDTVYYQVGNLFLRDSAGDSVASNQLLKGHYSLIFLPDSVCAEEVQRPLSYLARTWKTTADSLPVLQYVVLTSAASPDMDSCLLAVNPEVSYKVFTVENGRIESIRKDVLKMTEKRGKKKTFSANERLVLVDDKLRIRGYYDLGNEEEAERLMAEVKIIQHNYTHR